MYSQRTTLDSLNLLENEVNYLVSQNNDLGMPDVTYVGVDDEPLLPARAFESSGMIVNNLEEENTREELQEHILVIDSLDRDLSLYLSPFNFRYEPKYIFKRVENISLKAAVLPKKYSFAKTEVVVDASGTTVSELDALTSSDRNNAFTLTGDISGSFVLADIVDTASGTDTLRRIKFAPETSYPTIITQYYEYLITIASGGGKTYSSAVDLYTIQDASLQTNRFNLLYCDEYKKAMEFSSSLEIQRALAVLFPDTSNETVFYTIQKFDEKLFKGTDKGQIFRMTLSLRNAVGAQVSSVPSNDFYDTEVPQTKTCACSTDSDGFFVRDYRCPCSYIRHPYYHHFQVMYTLSVKAHEIEINKKLFY